MQELKTGLNVVEPRRERPKSLPAGALVRNVGEPAPPSITGKIWVGFEASRDGGKRWRDFLASPDDLDVALGQRQ